MPLSDEQSKQAYDSTLQPEEEKPKYWTVIVSVTIPYQINLYGMKDNVKERSLNIVKRYQPYKEAEYEITDITEQEGE